MSERTRIKDIARVAGVSTATVSRALSARERTSRRTTERPFHGPVPEPGRKAVSAGKARALYLSLLEAYRNEPSRTAKRALHPKLKAAHRRAVASAR